MYANNAIGRMILLRTTICVLVMGLISAAAAEEETDVLKITVGQPTLMSKLRYQNTAAVAVSRTGAVAAFYPKPGEGAKYYRISNDGGRTWGEELDFPPAYVGPMTVGRRGGGVLAMLDTSPVEGGPPDQLTCTRIIFSDDFLTFEEGISAVSIPNVVKHNKWGTRWPGFGIGKIVQLDNGDLLGTMHGNLRGDDNWYRTMVLRSTDEGENWEFHASIAFSLDDPHPQLVGSYCGYCEPSLALLSNGQLLCIMRTQGAQYAGEYRPLYQCWSDDLGETWTEPVLSQPFLMNIAPTLAVLDNGVVVCRYGRPGFHVAFSLDHGHTWQDRIRFSDLPEPVITGQFDLVKVGANSMVAIGSDHAGVKAWPIEVERVKVAQSHVVLAGQVLDAQGNPIADATVERSPNRYYLDAWLEHATDMDPWKATPMTVDSPVLGYRSIRTENGHPMVQTDAQGRFRFEQVKIGEYVLTVEADGFAPQSRNVKAAPKSGAEQFDLQPGRMVQGRVVDDTGQPVPGACIVLNLWHTHTDGDGNFDWSLEGPSPEKVQIRAYKRYDGRYKEFKGKTLFAELETQPIIIPRTK